MNLNRVFDILMLGSFIEYTVCLLFVVDKRKNLHDLKIYAKGRICMTLTGLLKANQAVK